MKKIVSFFIVITISLQSFANNGFLDLFKNTNDKKDKTLIIFYRPDCQYCQQMEQILAKEKAFSNSVTQKYNVQVLDITTPEGRLMADKFDVHAVPTIVNYDNLSGSVTTIKGFGNINKFAQKIGVAYQNKNIEKPLTTKTNLAACGDGIVNGGEQCDDGNLANGDGCSATCTIQVGFTCIGSPSVCIATCGDGIVAGSETCDDGNISNSDGCSATCNVEVGFSCSGSPSICSSICGDGIVGGSEQCDDGNAANSDGCSATCNVEVGFSCSGSPSTCNTICGDGIVGGSEQCDDGNTTGGDGCSATCAFEAPSNDNCVGASALSGIVGTAMGQNLSATTSVGVPSACSTLAKDIWFTFTLASSKRIKMELNGPSIDDPVLAIYSGTCGSLTLVACDDDGGPGNYSLVQTVLPAGTYYVRAGSYNTTNPGTLSLVYDLDVKCGNNILELNEECDDGNVDNGDGCSSICKTENAGSIVGVAINTDATRAAPSAMLDVKSFDRGVLVPRMSSAQRTAIAAPAKGLLVFDITTNTFWYFGTGWTEIGGQGGAAGSGLPAGTANQTLRSNGTNWVPNNTLQNDGTNVTVTGQVKINGGSPAVGKVLTSDAAGLSTWQAPAYDSSRNTYFYATNTSSQSYTGTLIPTLPNEGADDGNNFSSNVFTVPANGVYQFMASGLMSLSSVTSTSTIKIMIESTTSTSYGDQSVIFPSGHSGFYTLSTTAMAKLTAGTQIRIKFIQISGTLGSQSISSISFNGFRVY